MTSVPSSSKMNAIHCVRWAFSRSLVARCSTNNSSVIGQVEFTLCGRPQLCPMSHGAKLCARHHSSQSYVHSRGIPNAPMMFVRERTLAFLASETTGCWLVMTAPHSLDNMPHNQANMQPMRFCVCLHCRCSTFVGAGFHVSRILLWCRDGFKHK